MDHLLTLIIFVSIFILSFFVRILPSSAEVTRKAVFILDKKTFLDQDKNDFLKLLN